MTLARRRSQGFSFIELLTIMALIGILAAVAIPPFSAYRARGFNAQVMSAVREVATAEEAYYAAHLHYTRNVSELQVALPANVAIVLSAGNSGDLGTSFRVVGSHPGATYVFGWVSDPALGAANLSES